MATPTNPHHSSALPLARSPNASQPVPNCVTLAAALGAPQGRKEERKRAVGDLRQARREYSDRSLRGTCSAPSALYSSAPVISSNLIFIAMMRFLMTILYPAKRT